VASHDLGDDYDLIIYDDYTGSTDGFSNTIGGSYAPLTSTDFVVGHYDGTPTVVYPGIVCYDKQTGDMFSADLSDATDRQGGHAGSYTDRVLSFHRLTDVYELFLSAGQTYYVVLKRQSGTSDIAFEIFPATAGGVYRRGESPGGLGQSLAMTADLDTLAYTTTETGYYPVVVYRENGNDIPDEIYYSFSWGPGPLVDVPEDVAPMHDLAFHGVSPNPMMERGRVQFTLAERGDVRVTVFDLRGRSVGILLDETREPGPHSIHWDGRGSDGGRLGAGIYWLRLETGGRAITRRVVLLN
jgi:hypothetical protein